MKTLLATGSALALALLAGGCGSGTSDAMQNLTATGNMDMPASYAGYYVIRATDCLGGTCRSQAVGVNDVPVRCHDGSWSEACPVVQWDWSELGATAEEAAAYKAKTLAGAAIVYAEIDPVTERFALPGGNCRVHKVWLRSGDQPVSAEPIYEVANSRFRCLDTSPCLPIRVTVLDGSDDVFNVSSIDLTGVAGAADAMQAQADITSRLGILAAGNVETVADGSAMPGTNLVASQIFLLAAPRTVTTQP
jgi:hypothetical protein